MPRPISRVSNSVRNRRQPRRTSDSTRRAAVDSLTPDAAAICA